MQQTLQTDPLAPFYLGCARRLDRYLAALPAMSLIPFAPLR